MYALAIIIIALLLYVYCYIKLLLYIIYYIEVFSMHNALAICRDPCIVSLKTDFKQLPVLSSDLELFIVMD